MRELKTIKTEKGYVAVSDDEIKGDLSLFIDLTTNTIHKLHTRLVNSNNLYSGMNGGINHDGTECKKIIATNGFQLDNLPQFELENSDEDIDKLAKDYLQDCCKRLYGEGNMTTHPMYRNSLDVLNGVEYGYKAAKEKFKYSEEDLFSLLTYTFKYTFIDENNVCRWSLSKLAATNTDIKECWMLSLNKPKLLTSIEVEEEQINNKAGSSYSTETLCKLKTDKDNKLIVNKYNYL